MHEAFGVLLGFPFAAYSSGKNEQEEVPFSRVAIGCSDFQPFSGINKHSCVHKKFPGLQLREDGI